MGYCQGFEGRQGADGTIIATGTTAARLNFGVGTAVFRRDALNRLGGFQPVLRYGEDLDLLLRAHEAGLVIEIVSDVTLYYRIHASSSTHGKDIHELNLLTILKTSLDRRRSKVSPDVE
jgi:GT2 family glycosyltransferase